MSKVISKNDVETPEPCRKVRDITNDSRSIFNAYNESEQSRTMYFSEAKRLLQDAVYLKMQSNERFKDADTNYHHVIGKFTYKTLDKFLPLINNLAPSTVNDLFIAVDRHDLWLHSTSGPSSNEKEAGRKVTSWLLGWCRDLDKF